MAKRRSKYPKKPTRPKASDTLAKWETYEKNMKAWEKKKKDIDAAIKKKESIRKKYK